MKKPVFASGCHASRGPTLAPGSSATVRDRNSYKAVLLMSESWRLKPFIESSPKLPPFAKTLTRYWPRFVKTSHSRTMWLPRLTKAELGSRRRTYLMGRLVGDLGDRRPMETEGIRISRQAPLHPCARCRRADLAVAADCERTWVQTSDTRIEWLRRIP